MKWIYLRFDTYADDSGSCRSHLVEEPLLDFVLQDLIVRHEAIPLEFEEVTSTGMDLPGMVLIGRPLEKFKLPGLVFSIPSFDLPVILESFKKAEALPRGDKDGWIKVMNYHFCMCLTARHAAALTAQIQNRVKTAERRDREFYDERCKKHSPRSDV